MTQKKGANIVNVADGEDGVLEMAEDAAKRRSQAEPEDDPSCMIKIGTVDKEQYKNISKYTHKVLQEKSIDPSIKTGAFFQANKKLNSLLQQVSYMKKNYLQIK